MFLQRMFSKKMISKSTLILISFCCLMSVSAMVQTPSASGRTQTAVEGTQNKQPGAPKNDAQAMRDDIARMREIVQQMQMNLAFVDNTQSPLKHQFQLEIDAWTELINQMERRSQGNQR